MRRCSTATFWGAWNAVIIVRKRRSSSLAAEVQDQRRVRGHREVDVTPVGVDRRHREQLVEQILHLAVVGIGEDLALDAPQQLAADLVEVGEVRLRSDRVERQPGEVQTGCRRPAAPRWRSSTSSPRIAPNTRSAPGFRSSTW